MKAAGPSET